MMNEHQTILANFYRANVDHAIKIALSIVNNREAMEDVVHDTFDLVCTKWNEIEDKEAYFYTVLRKSAKSYLRRDYMTQRHEEGIKIHVLQSENTFSEGNIESGIFFEQVLEKLPSEFKIIFALKYVDWLEDKEICKKLGLGWNQYRYRLSLLLRHLRTFVNEEQQQLDKGNFG